MDKDLRIVKFVEALQAVGVDPKDLRVVSIIEEVLGETNEGLDKQGDFSVGDTVWWYQISLDKVLVGQIDRFIRDVAEISTPSSRSIYAVKVSKLYPWNYSALMNHGDKRFESGDRVSVWRYSIDNYGFCHVVGFSEFGAILYNPINGKIVTEIIENLRHV